MSEQVLGVVALTRHGDRRGFYQDPVTYAASDTVLTQLGEVQEYGLGQLLRSLYFTNGSASLIQGISTGLVDGKQVEFRADAGGEGSVIFDSALAITQGLFPTTSSSNTTLANGTVIISPLGGYQYVTIETVEPEQDISLEGFVDCPALVDANEEFLSSSPFEDVASANQDFLSSLTPLLDGRSNALSNACNIFDLLNVQSIHNASFAESVTDQQLQQARSLANYREHGIFSNAELDDISNIAGRTVLPDVLSALQSFTNTSQPLKYRQLVISYKPFISLFQMLGVSDTYPELQGIVDYASTVTFELRQAPESNYVVQLNVKNGTADFAMYNMFGNSGATPLSQFNSTLAPYAINTLSEWCDICNQHEERGCATIAAANETYGTVDAAPGQSSSPLASGFIGACVTLALLLVASGYLWYKGLLTIGRGARSSRHARSVSEDHPLSSVPHKGYNEF